MGADQIAEKLGEYTAYVVIILIIIWGIVKFVKSSSKH